MHPLLKKILDPPPSVNFRFEGNVQQALEEGLQIFVIEKIVKRRDVLGQYIEESNLPNVACKLGGLKIVRCQRL